jgi:hypothetical protein
MKPTAAARSAALLRQLDDANRQHQLDLMHHAPHCQRPSVTITHGHSVDVHKCDGCGCVCTTRHTTTDMRHDDDDD